MKLIINGEEAKIPSGSSSGGVTMDQVNSAIDTKLDVYEPQEVYSTEEVRIGTWIDGKPLYRKVMTYSIQLTTTSKVDLIDIPHSVETIVSRKLSIDYLVNGQKISLQIPYFENINTNLYWLWEYIDLSSDKMHFVCMFPQNCSATITCVLEYTKTIDQSQTASTNTVLKTPSKAPALNSIQSAAVTASAQEVLIDG